MNSHAAHAWRLFEYYGIGLPIRQVSFTIMSFRDSEISFLIAQGASLLTEMA